MKLSEAIALMRHQIERHGDVDVYFDCPTCGSSFAPDQVKALAAHFTETKAGSKTRA